MSKKVENIIETKGAEALELLEKTVSEVIKQREENKLPLLSSSEIGFNISFIPAAVAGVDSFYITAVNPSIPSPIAVTAIPVAAISLERFFVPVACAYDEFLRSETFQAELERDSQPVTAH